MDLQQIVSSTYEEAIKWRRNLFTLHKCTRVILEWVNDGELQSIAIEALMIAIVAVAKMLQKFYSQRKKNY